MTNGESVGGRRDTRPGNAGLMSIRAVFVDAMSGKRILLGYQLHVIRPDGVG
jgi:hypothetical protein